MQRLVVVVALAGACLLAGAACLAAASGQEGRRGILFVRRPHARGRGRPQIYLWRAAGSRRVSRSPNPMDYPAWAPDGKLVAFAGIRGGWDQSAPYDIWTMRPDGRHLSRVTNEAAHRGALRAVEPSWSPTGRQIVFTRQFTDRPDALAVVSPHSRRERALHVGGDHPAWGKAGIAYVGGAGIMLLDLSSGHAAVFAAPRGRVIAIAWSARGELAALEGEFGQRIVVYSSTGHELRAFKTPSAAAGTCGVTWSPDGRRLLVQVEEYSVLRNRLSRGRRPPAGAFTGFWTVTSSGRHWRRMPFRPAPGASCTVSWR